MGVGGCWLPFFVVSESGIVWFFVVPRSDHGGLEDITLVGCRQKRPFYPTFKDSPLEEMEDDVFGDTDLSHLVEKKPRLSF